MQDYEYVEINSLEELQEFIESATKEELILLRQDIQRIKEILEEEEGSSGGRQLVLKKRR